MGKKIKKLVSNSTGGLLGGDEKKAATVNEPVTAPAASVVETPKTAEEVAAETDTEAAKKNARSQGKRSLQVSRSAGSGLNI